MNFADNNEEGLFKLDEDENFFEQSIPQPNKSLKTVPILDPLVTDDDKQ